MTLDTVYRTVARTASQWRMAAIGATLVLSLASCTQQQASMDTHESLLATLWTQTAAEYSASTTQAYHTAIANLDLALADPQWSAALEQQGDYSTLPPAVLMDIDQTVLDNARYNARIVKQYGKHSSKMFNQWCEEEAAPAVPGAKAFVDYAQERGVTIIYYSRRIEALRDCTTRNLQTLGFPVTDQKYLLLNNGQANTRKGYLRTQIAKQFRILLLVGDDLEDFVAGSKTDSAVRRGLASEHSQRWGRQWIILPNPMYGAWDTSLYQFEYSLPRDQQLEFKHGHLEE